MNYSRIKNLMKVEVFCTEMDYPSPVDKDFMVKEEAYYNSHAWRMGVVIEKEERKHVVPRIVVSFNRALTSAARKGKHNLKEYKERADYIRLQPSRGYEFITVRPLGNKEECLVKEVGYIVEDIRSLRSDIIHLRDDMRMITLAYGELLTETDKQAVEYDRSILKKGLLILTEIHTGWEDPIINRQKDPNLITI